MEKEEQMLLAALRDKIQQCQLQAVPTNSTFLDLRERSLAATLCAKETGLYVCFYGGYEEAERTLCLCFPDWLPLAGWQAVQDYFTENSEESPLALLRVRHNSKQELTHRDYLGALMHLGMKRECIGDILVHPQGCEVIILKNIGGYLQQNLERAGNAALQLELLPVNQIQVPEANREEVRCSVASLRLDAVAAAVFGLARTAAAEAIAGGMVFVNGLQKQKPDALLQAGDKLVLRGKGKVVLQRVAGQTKKGRLLLVLQKYL